MRFCTGTAITGWACAPMPRFYFDITDNGRIEIDDEGAEFPDLEVARKDAANSLVEIAKDALPDGDARDFVIDIREGDGPPQITIRISLRVERRA